MTPFQIIERFGALPPHLFKTAVLLLAQSNDGRVDPVASRLARQEGIDPRNIRERLRKLRERKVLVPHPDGYGFRIDPGWNKNGCEHPAVERMQTSADGADADIRNPDPGIPPEDVNVRNSDANVRNSDADIRTGGERGGSSSTMERPGESGQEILLPELLADGEEENTRAARMPTSADPDADIREALCDLNAVCGTDFDLTAKTRKLGLALLRHPDKAASLDDFRLVHRHMHRQWKDDRTRSKNLRPSTLWWRDNFMGYLNDARRWAARDLWASDDDAAAITAMGEPERARLCRAALDRLCQIAWRRFEFALGVLPARNGKIFDPAASRWRPWELTDAELQLWIGSIAFRIYGPAQRFAASAHGYKTQEPKWLRKEFIEAFRAFAMSEGMTLEALMTEAGDAETAAAEIEREERTRARALAEFNRRKTDPEIEPVTVAPDSPAMRILRRAEKKAHPPESPAVEGMT